MVKKLTAAILLSAAAVAVMVTAGCRDVAQVSATASEALQHRNYAEALGVLSDLPDRTLEENDSLFLMLAEAYYGVTCSSVNIEGDAVCDMDLSPDGKWILFTDLRNGRVAVYSYPELRFYRMIETGSPVYGIDFSPDGSMVAAALSNTDIGLFDFASGERINSLKGHTNRVRTVAFLDSTHLVSGGNDQNVITWDLEQGKAIDSQWRHRKNVKNVKRSPDGQYAVSASNDGTAIVWDFSDKSHGKESRKVTHGRNYVNDAALSPDNRFLVTASGDGDVKVWNAQSGVMKKALPLEDAGVSVEFSPDGSLVAVGGYAFVHLIETDGWVEIGKIPVSNDALWGLKFIGDDRLAFVDSSHFYEVDVLSRKQLVEAARSWLKQHDNKARDKKGG